jgi:hypothetical protein
MIENFAEQTDKDMIDVGYLPGSLVARANVWV